MVGCYLHIRIDGNHLLLGAFHLRGVQVLGLVDDLSLQVAEVNHIGIHEYRYVPRLPQQGRGYRRAQATGTNDEYLGVEELFLSLEATS